jgi:hypothetical protein
MHASRTDITPMLQMWTSTLQTLTSEVDVTDADINVTDINVTDVDVTDDYDVNGTLVEHYSILSF